MKKTRVAINGFGRIGRAFFRVAFGNPGIEIVGINDLGDLANLAYLLKYDSVYRTYAEAVSHDQENLLVSGKKIPCSAEKDPSKLPWKSLDVDVVIEATGFFTTYADAALHLNAGAKRVIITAPAKGDPAPGIASGTVLMGINESALASCVVSSNASCTTNAASPLIAILDEAIGIEKAILNTVHAYTATQALVDSPAGKKGFREGRAAAANIIPSGTGAAVAVTKAFPKLEGLFDGVSLRVPVIAGSIVDVTFIAKRATTADEVNAALKAAATTDRWRTIFSATEEHLVSSDILGSSYASIADLAFTRVVGGNLVKVLAWYDNEMGYTHTLVEHVIKTGATIN